MAVTAVWGHRRLELTTAILDVNGTLTVHGQLVSGVVDRMNLLRDRLRILLVSSDSFGNLEEVGDALHVLTRRVESAEGKAAILAEAGPQVCVGIGNGNNDRLLLRDAALGVAVMGSEGLAPALLTVADIICPSISDALDLLLDPRRIAATLRP